MARCDLIGKCIFFNDRMAGMPSTAFVYKKIFCEDKFGTCARFIVCMAKGRENVPTDLFPNQLERANQIIAA